MASMILGSIGSSIAGPIGGFIGSALGSYIDNMIFSSMQEPQEGPRLSDLKTVAADPGTPIPLVYGADRIPGIIVAASDLIEVKNKERVGGKGGGQEVITYSYYVDIDYMLCKGPILGVARIWADGNLIRGTSYEMETSTAAYPENIGGIPYPEWYPAHLYDPDLIPRNFEDINATGTTYRMSADGWRMLPGVGADKPINRPTYNQDADTGYYIPTTGSHAYTGEKFKGDEWQGSGQKIVDGPTETYLGNDGEGRVHRAKVGAEIIEIDQLQQSTLVVTLEWAIFSVQWNLSTHYLEWGIRWYKSGENGFLDVSDPNTSLGGFDDGKYISLADADEIRVNGGQKDGKAKLSFSSTAPEGAEYAVWYWSYASMFPIWHAFGIQQNKGEFRFDERDKNAPRDWPDYWNLYDAINDWSKYAVLGFDLSASVTLYHGQMDQFVDPVMDAVQFDEDVLCYPAYIGRAHIVFGELQLEHFGNRIPNMTFEAVQFDNTRASTVIEDLFERAGVEPEYYDVSELLGTDANKHVLGYSIGRKTNFRAAMETLLEAFRVDAAEIGNSILFRARDRGRDYTIDYSDLSAVDAGEDVGDRVTITYRNQLELPKSLTVAFKDVERDYQKNTARFARGQGVSVQDTQIELAACLPPAYAKAYARDKLRDMWLERVGTSASLPHKYVYIYPSDIVYVDGSSVGKSSFTMKVTQISRGANGIIEIEGVLRADNLYVPQDGETDPAAMDNYFPGRQTVDNVLKQSWAVLMDLPPLSNTQGNEGYYVAMGGFGDAWPGAALYRSPTDDETYEVVTSGTIPAIMGYVQDQLNTADPEYIDYTNTVTIVLHNKNDELESISWAEFFNGRNLIVIGDEVIIFKNATRVEKGVYTIDTLLRGRRGTGISARTKAKTYSTEFAFIQPGIIKDVADTPNFRDVDLPYKAVTSGSFLSDTYEKRFTRTGERVKPLPPVHVTGYFDGASNDMTISWVRQDRVHQDWVSGADIPNSEATESYEVDIVDDSNTVVRTFTVSNSTEVTYTQSQRQADNLADGELFTAKVYQMSATIGRGKEGSGDIINGRV